jgi:uncharacterized protein YaaN involved in tellurite resistance
VTFGEPAQRSVVEFADRVLAQTQNHELGNTGALLSEILGKARGLDEASLKDANFVTRLFSSVQGRLRRFKEQFDDVASQIDRITVALDRNKETLRRDIALLDELHEETKSAITQLDTHIAAGKAFAQEFRSGGLAELERTAKAQNAGSDTLLAALTRTLSRRLIGSKSASSIWSRRARSASNSFHKSPSFSPATRRSSRICRPQPSSRSPFGSKRWCCCSG